MVYVKIQNNYALRAHLYIYYYYYYYYYYY